jgi:hypothetical protein
MNEVFDAENKNKRFYYTDNKKMRFLNAHNWEIQAAKKSLDILQSFESESDICFHQKVFCHCGTDKEGRPNIYMSVDRLQIKDTTTLKNYLIVFVENVLENTPFRD